MEVMIATAIFGMVLAGSLGSALFVMRQSQESRARMTAYNFANSIFEELRGLPYGEIGTNTNLAANYIGTLTFSPERDGQVSDQEFTAVVRYSGFGTVTGSTSTTLTDSTASWATNEWVGDFVMIASGPGSGQIARITSNTATQLTVTFDIGTGVNDSAWRLPLTAGSSMYEINYGKTVDLTVSWRIGEKNFEVQRRAFITRRSAISS